MKVDIYAHIVPPKYKDFLENKAQAALPPLGHIASMKTMFDLDERFRIMDRFPDVMQVLTFGAYIPSDAAAPKQALDLSRRVNDEMAELVNAHPNRFAAAVAVVPLNDIDAALRELERAINELHCRGVLIRVPINGRPPDLPEFMPLYEAMERDNLPIWIHPQREPHVPDYAAEKGASKYMVWILWGLLYETTVAMTRLAFGGVLDKYPTLKFITHHCGGMVPFFSARIEHSYDLAELRLGPGWNYKRGLTQQPVEYFRKFYVDTAVNGNASALMCAYDFFGPEHLLFGTDFPADAQMGIIGTRSTVEAIDRLAIPDSEKKKIFEDNSNELCRLPLR